ncbi:MAG TPA: ShlB/FhaC/HecB family hemolysin secretion/activation protein [Cyanophyceae cyanobacterium]
MAQLVFNNRDELPTDIKLRSIVVAEGTEGTRGDNVSCLNATGYSMKLVKTHRGEEINIEPNRIIPSVTPQPMAQNNPNLPPGVLEPTRPSLSPLPSIPSPSLTPSPLFTSPPETPPTPPPDLEIRVKVKRVEVLGSTVFSSQQLQDVVAPFIGKDATFEELLAIRTAITRLYTDNGYTTSGAFLPSQDLTDGVVKIQVVEGTIEKIEIQGLRRLREGYVRDRILAATQAPVNLRHLEEALQRLQLNPLITTVQAELSTGTSPGLSLLKLKVTEAQPLAVAVSVDNRDSPSVGEIGGTLSVSYNDLLGFGDRVSANYSISEGLNSYDLSYELPVNSRDGTLNFSYSQSNSEIVEQPFSALDINAEAHTISLGFRQPIVHTPTAEFALSWFVDLRESQTFLLDDIPFSFTLGPENGESKITALRFTQDWTNRSKTQVVAVRSQFTFGFDALGATVNDSGIDGRFISWLGQFQWVQALGRDTILITRVGTQLSLDSLLPLEQFSIGGVDTVRGYRQNQRVGDNGVIGSMELRFSLLHQPNGMGTLELTPFFDFGTVWNNQGDTLNPNTLASIGLGLHWQPEPDFSAYFNWGIPLISISDSGQSLQDNGISFSVRWQPF